jgi:hypothetical protein
MIRTISESEYEQSVYPVLFEEENNRVYATISDNTGFKFAWQSDKIKPCLVKVNANVFALGADTNFAIIDLFSQKIILKIQLDCFLYDIKIIENFLHVITELEIVTIDLFDYEIIKRYDLPDILETIEIMDTGILINCMDGQIICLEVQEKNRVQTVGLHIRESASQGK